MHFPIRPDLDQRNGETAGLNQNTVANVQWDYQSANRIGSGGGRVRGDGSGDYAMDSAAGWLVQGILARPARLSASGARAVRRCVPLTHRTVARTLPLSPRPRSARALRPPEKLSARLALSTAA